MEGSLRKAALLFMGGLALGGVVVGAGVAAVEGTSSSGNIGRLAGANFGVQGTGSGANDGVYGISTTGYAVHGVSTSGTAIAGSSGSSNGPDSAAILGGCAHCIGVGGVSTDFVGAFGRSNGTLQNPFSMGVYGYAPNGAIGVYGEAPLSGWAGYFKGDVEVTHTLYQSNSASRIDDPLDPSNKYLTQPFVESSEMKSVYDGTVTLDHAGEATVELPAWCEAVNKDFRYQLTPIGEHASLYIAEEVNENKFRIAGGYEGRKVSWQVTGVRRDPYAEAYRTGGESLKPMFLRGRLLHPELYGRPQSESVDFEREKTMQAAQAIGGPAVR